MRRLCTVSSINPRRFDSSLRYLLSMYVLTISSVITMITGVFIASLADAQERQRAPMELSVVAVNPSNTKTQTIPIKMYLPQEVTPDAILDSAGLNVEFDADKSMYYLFQEGVELKPSETKTYTVEIKDVWIIPQGRLDSLSDQAHSVIERLQGSQFYESAKLLGDAIDDALKTIAVTQNDEAVSKRTHIGIFRNNLQVLDQVKEDVERLERQLEIVMSLPKPEVLENAELKTESPDENTSWMIIFIIMLFIGMLAGVFFFTWQTQAHTAKNLIADARDASFPERGGDDEEKKE